MILAIFLLAICAAVLLALVLRRRPAQSRSHWVELPGEFARAINEHLESKYRNQRAGRK